MTDKILRADLTAISYIQSCTFKEQVNTAECLRFGAAVARSIEFTVFGTQSDAPSVGEVLTYYQTDENGVDTLIGTFIAQPSIPGKNTFTVVAYDNISLLETDFSAHLETIQSNFPMTLSALLTEVATVAGVTFGNSPTMASMNVEEFSVSGVSCRDVVSWAAELSGQYVYCDTNGDIMFGWYSTVSGKKVYKTSGSGGGVTYVPYKQGGLAYKDFAVSAVDAVAVFPANVEGAAVVYPNTTGNIYSLTNNLLLSGASTATLNSVAQTLYTVLSALSAYRPCTINLFRFDNPFRAGDIIQVEDAQGVTFTTMVMSMTVTMDGATIECTGRETYDADKGSSVSTQLVNLANNIVRIDKLKVDWADINTAIINYLTTNNVTAQNLTIVDAANNVLATFNASGITLGDPNSGHMELDFNSLEIFDQYQNKYVSFGDLRDENGVATINYEFVAGSPLLMVSFSPSTSDTSTAVAYINGVQDTGATFTSSSVTFSNYLTGGDAVLLVYETTDPAYHYDLGEREAGSNIGFCSVANGHYPVASATYSTVGGGNNNDATGQSSTVAGGSQNQAGPGPRSTVCGGSNNKAQGAESVICGGILNKITAQRSVISGGNGNEITGGYAAIMGGYYNSVSATYGAAVGYSNKVTSNYGFAFGKFNDPGNYAEMVGGGTSDSNRANLRTLDWSGNEVLAGGLTINGTETVSASDFKIFDSVADIGLASGSATISGAYTAMPADSILIVYADNFAVAQVPNTTGTVVIVKRGTPRGYVLFYGKRSTDADYRMFINDSNVPDGTWIPEKPNNITSVTQNLLSGANTSSNPYVCPTDGYAVCYCTSGSVGTVNVCGAGQTSAYVQIGNEIGRYSVFVRAGMKLWYAGSPNTARFAGLS